MMTLMELWASATRRKPRAASPSPSLTIPFTEGKLLLGTWQQVVLADFDSRPRHREVVLQIMGE